MAQDPSDSSKDSKDKARARGPAGQSPAQTGAGAQQGPGSGGSGQAGAAIDPQLVQQVAQALAGLVPTNVLVQQAQLPRVPLEEELAKLQPVTVAFPPCSDVLLALIHMTNADPINDFFDDYFRFKGHHILASPRLFTNERPEHVLDPGLLECTSPPREPEPVESSQQTGRQLYWPPPWCLPPSCVTLDGNRRMPIPQPDPPLSIKRLLLGDLVWLFFFERMGIFKILGVILDDFATRGQYPISNGDLEGATIKDDVVALVVEAMCRQTKMGLSSTVRDRDATYRRCLGWTSDVGRPLGIPAQVNKGVSQLFHKFIQAAIRFNEAKRLASAIQGVTVAARPSIATLVEIADTITQLKQRLEVLHYGRNYYNTLAGIVWTVAGLALIRDLRTTLGIPPAYGEPHEYIPAAYDKLVLGGSVTPTTINRFEAHKDCATFGRNLLLDIEVLPEAALSNPQPHPQPQPDSALDLWLTQVEGEIEGYRKAYRDLTGADLGAPGTPTIEQEA